MNTHEAARLLGVASHEVLEVRHDTEGWWALHEDMASHIRLWRNIPAWQLVGERSAEIAMLPSGAVVRESGTTPEEVATGPAVDVDGDGVPDGTAAQILEWVGDDPGRAERALAAESARDRPRTVLTAALEKLVG